MSTRMSSVVLIHVHEGTIIHSWSFRSLAVQDAFEAAYRSTWDEAEYHLRHLPDGTLDDPDSDTWIVVEGSIWHVDGSGPQLVCGCGDPLSHGKGSDEILHVAIEAK